MGDAAGRLDYGGIYFAGLDSRLTPRPVFLEPLVFA